MYTHTVYGMLCYICLYIITVYQILRDGLVLCPDLLPEAEPEHVVQRGPGVEDRLQMSRNHRSDPKEKGMTLRPIHERLRTN